MTHYPRDRTAKLVIRFKAGPLFSRGYFLKYSHLAIPARLHCPKGDESLLYRMWWLVDIYEESESLMKR